MSNFLRKFLTGNLGAAYIRDAIISGTAFIIAMFTVMAAAILCVYEVPVAVPAALAFVSPVGLAVGMVFSLSRRGGILPLIEAQRDIDAMSTDEEHKFRVELADKILGAGKKTNRVAIIIIDAVTVLCVIAAAVLAALFAAGKVDAIPVAGVALTASVLIPLCMSVDSWNNIYAKADDETKTMMETFLLRSDVDVNVIRNTSGGARPSHTMTFLADSAMKQEHRRIIKKDIIVCGIVAAVLGCAILVITGLEDSMDEKLFVFLLALLCVVTIALFGVAFFAVNRSMDQLFERNGKKLADAKDDRKLTLQSEYYTWRRRTNIAIIVFTVIGLVVGIALAASGVINDEEFTRAENAVLSFMASVAVSALIAVVVCCVLYVIYARRVHDLENSIWDDEWKKAHGEGR